MGFEFLLDLLDILTNKVVYHLLIFLALFPAAGIVWTEWRNGRAEALRSYVWAGGGVLLLHFGAFVLACLPIMSDSVLAVLTTPFLYAEALLSTGLLLWAFGSVIWKARAARVARWALGGGAVLVLLMTVGWGLRVWSSDDSLTYHVHAWQVPFWYALSASVAFFGVGMLWKSYQRQNIVFSVLVAFVILGLGSLCALLGAPVLGSPWRAGEAIGRFLILLGYPFFAIALYESSLKDLNAYRQELQGLSQDALRQSRELLFLIEATHSIGDAFDVRAMLAQVMENVVMVLSADRVAVFLYDQMRSDSLSLVMQYEVLGGYHTVSRDVLWESYPLLGRALLEYKTMFSDPDEMEFLQGLFDLLEIEKPGPVLIQPLARQERVLGVLIACNDHSGVPFNEDQERLAATIAVQIAGALENSYLYRDVELKAKELSTLLRVREAELDRQEAIFESVVEGILVSDPDGYVILMNAAAKEILGIERYVGLSYRVTELLGRMSPNDDLHPEDLVGLGGPLETTFCLQDRTIRVHAAPVPMESHIGVGMVAILQDITREQLAEESKRDFITSISHELRTPLTAIKGYTEMMLSGMAGELPQPFRQFLQVIHGNTLRMSYLTDNIISVSEIDRGRIGLNYQEVDVLKLLEDTFERYSARITERGLELHKEFASPLPVLKADPHRLRLILDNLLDNAIKFTPSGGRIVLGCRAIEGRLEAVSVISLWVSDTGVGIKVDEQHRIWERFYRADNPLSLEAGGLGIGLTITKALVEAHGGRIWVDSTPGEGSTFTILLPTQRVQGLEDMLKEVSRG